MSCALRCVASELAPEYARSAQQRTCACMLREGSSMPSAAARRTERRRRADVVGGGETRAERRVERAIEREREEAMMC